MPDPIDQTAQQVPPPARRPSFAERLKPQRIDLEDVPEPPALLVEEEGSPEPEKGSAEMPKQEDPKVEAEIAVEVAPPPVATASPVAEVQGPAEPVASAVQPAHADAAPDMTVAASDGPEELPQAAEGEKTPPVVFKAPPLPTTSSEFTLRGQAPGSDPFEDAPSFLPGNPIADLESEADMKHETVMRMIDENMNSISSGDDLFIPERPKKTLAEELAELGFPPRPHLWPPMMSWPQLRDMELLRQQGLSKQILEDYLKAQEIRQAKMLDRAATINDWIREHNRKQGHLRTIRINFNKKKPYMGVNWACLLDEDTGRNPDMHRVYSWGHMRARTADGGVVRAFNSNVKVDVVTMESVRLAVLEARARGWKTLRLTGDPEFTKHAIQICRQANIAAEITVRATPLSPFRRKFHMTPSLPGASDPGGAPEKGGAGLPALANLREVHETKKLPRAPGIAIPDHGLEEMPKSPFASGISREDDNESSLLEDMKSVSGAKPKAAEKIADRLAFGAPLEDDPDFTEAEPKKAAKSDAPGINP